MSAEDRTHSDQMKLQRSFSLGISNSEDKPGNKLLGEAEDFSIVRGFENILGKPLSEIAWERILPAGKKVQ